MSMNVMIISSISWVCLELWNYCEASGSYDAFRPRKVLENVNYVSGQGGKFWEMNLNCFSELRNE